MGVINRFKPCSIVYPFGIHTVVTAHLNKLFGQTKASFACSPNRTFVLPQQQAVSINPSKNRNNHCLPLLTCLKHLTFWHNKITHQNHQKSTQSILITEYWLYQNYININRYSKKTVLLYLYNKLQLIEYQYL